MLELSVVKLAEAIARLNDGLHDQSRLAGPIGRLARDESMTPAGQRRGAIKPSAATLINSTLAAANARRSGVRSNTDSSGSDAESRTASSIVALEHGGRRLRLAARELRRRVCGMFRGLLPLRRP